MQTYLHQLLLDLDVAKKRVPPSPDLTGLNIAAAYWKERDESPHSKLSEWFGLEMEQFPLAERWTRDQLSTVIQAIEDLWAAFKFKHDIPADLPPSLHYELLVEGLEMVTPYISQGGIDLYFCINDQKNCPFGKALCRCYKDFPEPEAVLEFPEDEVEMSPKMKRYFDQLMEDIDRACKNLPTMQWAERDEHPAILELEQLKEMPYKPMAVWFDIPRSALPTLNLLSIPQRIQLVEAMEDLWNAYNFLPDFPDRTPVELKYDLMKDDWDTEVQYLPDGEIVFSFCDGDEALCPFGEALCDCNQEEEEPPFNFSDIDDEELPF